MHVWHVSNSLSTDAWLLAGVLHCFGRGNVRFLHAGAVFAPFGSASSRWPRLAAQRLVVLTFHCNVL
jgi:hypothetical protein